jgi:hypothetical protein
MVQTTKYSTTYLLVLLVLYFYVVSVKSLLSTECVYVKFAKHNNDGRIIVIFVTIL